MAPPRDPLEAISPLDGRYASRTAPLVPYASESALIRARVRVEVDYLLALADLDPIPLSIDDDDRAAMTAIYRDFDLEDARLVKRIETEGHGDYPATNHDVKAVEYFLRERLPPSIDADQWIHFGLTSEDVNNLAYRLLIRGAVTEVLLARLTAIQETLEAGAAEFRSIPMLARTHGQPATPTTFGKELAVYASRLSRSIDRIRSASDALAGKLAGASGTYAAHHVAFPEVDWHGFARDFVATYDLQHEPLVTQVNPCDDLARLFDAVRGTNAILLDLDLDMWLYVSDGYLKQRAAAGETGSSTMPHKVNPIDFENSEGNLSKANADLTFLAETITRSRLQRDLSDSTVKRTIGTALGHALLGYEKCLDGLETIAPDEAAMRADLEANPAVLGEAIQTVLRAAGDADAYERVKEATRGREVTIEDLRSILADVDVDPSMRSRLERLTPATYLGVADGLVDELE